MARQARSWEKKLFSRVYPVVGADAVGSPANIVEDIRKVLPDGILSKLRLRLVGNITKVGAAAGAATGRENPEELIQSIQITSNPSFGGTFRRLYSMRALLLQQIMDRGFSVRGTDISDAAGTVAVDFEIEIPVKFLNAMRPIEFGVPMRALTGLEVNIQCGGRSRLFTGGTPPTWDFSALRVELWADQDRYVSADGLPKDGYGRPAFHFAEEYQITQTITANQADYPIDLEGGYEYSSLLILTERDNVPVDDIITDIGVESGARQWLTRGDTNAAHVRRKMLERGLPSESLAGAYFVDLLPDGMASRAADALEDKLRLVLNVTVGGGTTRNITVHARRFKRLAVPFPQAA